MITKTSYTDKDGNKKTGYIKNGLTYTDQSLTTRIPTGSVVSAGGNTYYLGGERDSGVKIDTATGEDDSFYLNGKAYKTYYGKQGDAFVDSNKTVRVPEATMYKDGIKYQNDKDLGMVPTMSGVGQIYKNQMQESMSGVYSAADARVQASNAAMNQRLQAIKNRERKVREEKREADRLSYNAYLQAINPYGARAESIARLGLSNSGFGETSLTSLGNTYQQALAGNEKARADAMSELATLADQARAEGNRAQFEIWADMYKTLADLNLKQAEHEGDLNLKAIAALNDKNALEDKYEREDRIRAEQNAREDRIRAEEMEHEKKLRAMSKSSASNAKSGYNEKAVAQVVDFLLNEYVTLEEAAEILGITEEELSNMIKSYYGK